MCLSGRYRIYVLVGALEHFVYFSTFVYIGNNNPTDFLTFQRCKVHPPSSFWGTRYLRSIFFTAAHVSSAFWKHPCHSTLSVKSANIKGKLAPGHTCGICIYIYIHCIFRYIDIYIYIQRERVYICIHIDSNMCMFYIQQYT